MRNSLGKRADEQHSTATPREHGGRRSGTTRADDDDVDMFTSDRVDAKRRFLTLSNRLIDQRSGQAANRVRRRDVARRTGGYAHTRSVARSIVHPSASNPFAASRAMNGRCASRKCRIRSCHASAPSSPTSAAPSVRFRQPARLVDSRANIAAPFAGHAGSRSSHCRPLDLRAGRRSDGPRRSRAHRGWENG